MPYAAPTRCTAPSCTNMATRRGRCDDHATQYRRQADKRRPNGYRRGYTREWSAFSKQYLIDHPYCTSAACLQIPAYARPPATDVDHIDGTGRNGPHAYEEWNLQALCHRCHSIKTAEQDGSFGRA